MALDHEQPDRVPTDFWAVPEVWERLISQWNFKGKEELLEFLDVDIRLKKPDYIGAPVEKLPDGSFYEIDGTHRKRVKNNFGSFSEYASYPLELCETPEEIYEYARWPQVSDYDWAGFSEKIGDHNEKYYIKVEVGGPFEMSWALRGLEQFLVDMVIEPEIIHALMETRTNYYIDYINHAVEAAGDKIDAFYTYDDIATQNSLLMSKDMWREFIKPYHKKINQVIKSHGKKVIYHSCGSVISIIDELADLPIDVLNPLQPKAAGMDMQLIKDKWGDKLCFHGAICIQELLPSGTPEQVYEETTKTIKILGKNGGYIMSAAHHIQNDTPAENILAMYKAAKDCIV